MARTPNYRFERSERDRKKAAKKAAKAEKLAQRKDDQPGEGGQVATDALPAASAGHTDDTAQN